MSDVLQNTSNIASEYGLSPAAELLKRQGSEAFLSALELVRIDWQQTSLTVLAKLIEYEAVHAMESWEDLRIRLRSDKRIYALFHPFLPLDPLIFINISFSRGIPDNIQKLLNKSSKCMRVRRCDTACFYSISNTTKDVHGLKLGDRLIKNAVAVIEDEYPHIKQFVTLSPILAFRPWLERQAEEGMAEAVELAEGLSGAWYEDEAIASRLKPKLLELCARYLCTNVDGKGSPDPVANFHLANGARIERLNWMADMSEKGLQQSAGIMVNYNYRLLEINENRHEYENGGKIVASSDLQEYL